MSVASNVTLPVLKNHRRLGFLLRADSRKRLASDLAERVHLRPPQVQTLVGNLSGGNQQKVVIAKWLATDARGFIFDEPTRGIDVGAKAEIYRIMEELADGGAAILMISSDLPEVLRMSDRILIMRSGKVVLDVAREDASENVVGSAMTGATETLTPEPSQERRV
jgi:ABC-type sugar transport system ATPase subunit